jgi:hypothetical protein
VVCSKDERSRGDHINSDQWTADIEANDRDRRDRNGTSHKRELSISYSSSSPDLPPGVLYTPASQQTPLLANIRMQLILSQDT